MIYQHYTMTYYLFLLNVLQVAWLTCQEQEGDFSKGSWDQGVENSDLTEENLVDNFESGLSSWAQNEMDIIRPGKGKGDFSGEKIAGKDLRENGKRRKIMMKHNRIKVSNGMRQQENGEDISNVAQFNLTKGKSYMTNKKYGLIRSKKIGTNANRSDAMTSMLMIHGHNIRPPNSRKHFDEVNTKLGHSRGHSANKIKEFYFKDLINNESHENAETSTEDASLENELYEKRNNQKGPNVTAKHVEEIIIQRNKIHNEKSAEDKQENENQNKGNQNTQHLKKTNLDYKDFKLNSNGNKKDENKDKVTLNIDTNHFTNLSVINKSFLDAFAKKIYGLRNNISSNFNTKESSNFDTTKPATKSHSNKGEQWIFNNKKITKNRHEKDQFDRTQGYGKPYLNKDLANEKHETAYNRKLHGLHQNLPIKNVSIQHEDKKYHNSQPLMTKQSMEESKSNKNHANPMKNMKRRRAVRRQFRTLGHIKYRHNDGSFISENELIDPNSSNNIELSDIALDSNMADGKRSERDTSKHNTHDKTHIKSFFNEHPREEIGDQTFDENVPESQGDSISGMETDSNEMSESKPARLEGTKSKEVQENSNTRQNKQRLKDEEVDLEDYSNIENRHYESKSNDEEYSTSDSCVEYKAEESTTEQTTTTINYSTDKISSTKNPTTPKNKKPKTTKKPENDASTNATVTVEIGNYEQFLCGQLVDSFIDSVLRKVQRSKKLSQELGLGNYTEDSCDRCVELKPNNIPDLEPMKEPLGECLNNSATRCYRVPNIMGRFLKSLLHFEKENEQTVHNKILDDSSFIFTGDYAESWSHNENGISDANYNKHDADREGFDKESLDKQRLKEDNSDDKGRDPGTSSVKEDIVKKSSHLKDKSEHENGDSVAQKKSGREGLESEIKSTSREGFEDKKEKGTLGVRKPVESDENLKDNELVDVYDDQDVIQSNRRQYSGYKDLENDLIGSLSATPAKRTRKNYDIDNISNFKTDISKLSNNQHDRKGSNDPYGQRNYHYMKANPEMPKAHMEEIRSRDNLRSVDNSRQKYDNSLRNEGSSLQNGFSKFLPQPVENNKLNTYSRKMNYYFPEVYRNSGNSPKSPRTSILYSEPNTYINKDRENVEYPLYPTKWNINVRDMPSMSKNVKNDYDSALTMVKRDTEPYEDELIFFEIPDIEYDLY